VQKLCGGLGIFGAGQILAWSAFPQAAKAGAVPLGAIDRMTLWYVGAMILFYGGGAIFYAFFPFGRAEHEARLEQAAVRIDSAIP
jgi:GPH family glycoside/pentoside/hexuronide:cation symporter